jgi:cell wall-associated NlpC family hydrolase
MSEAVQITRADIEREALSLLDVPFRHQGDDPEFGVDCRGVLLTIGRRLGYQLKRTYRNNYSSKPDPVEFRAGLANEFEEISIEEMKRADIALCWIPREPGATHVGVLVSGLYEPMFLHASRKAGKVIKEPLRKWQDHIVAGFRFEGIVDG